jgi:hypothetical protein
VRRCHGCQIFLGTKYQTGKNIPNYHKMYQMAIKIFQPFPIQGPPKFTQIWIFCLKIYHLATLAGASPHHPVNQAG